MKKKLVAVLCLVFVAVLIDVGQVRVLAREDAWWERSEGGWRGDSSADTDEESQPWWQGDQKPWRDDGVFAPPQQEEPARGRERSRQRIRANKEAKERAEKEGEEKSSRWWRREQKAWRGGPVLEVISDEPDSETDDQEEKTEAGEENKKEDPDSKKQGDLNTQTDDEGNEDGK